ncbi:MAG: DUF1800 domain-containing protein, partial [Acidobacteriota bacterium]|nr:DUF1800 domain-containing protein [Acidobacteriota bacterium]
SAAAEGPATPPSFSAPLNQRQKAELLLRRITFGSRPGDVEQVEAMGLNNFLNQQLHPRTLDDSAVEARLTNIETLAMPAAELAEDVREAQRRQKERRLAGLNQQGAMAASSAAEAGPLRPGFRRFGVNAGAKMQPESDAAQQEAPPTANEPAPAMNDTSQTNGDSFFPPREILTQLGQEELLRAVYSRRQLQEVMVRFWMNHFNIYWNKGADRYYLTSFEENVIRPHALGNFEDLLIATAESPAMLFYLDNWMSVAPNQQSQPALAMRPLRPFGPFGPRPAVFRPFPPAARNQNKKGKRERGLNENYGRELMELHTIGLHYTQQDVIEAARCFTGWTIRQPGQGGGFFFNPRQHDYGKKVVLGYVIPAGRGIEDGLEVLHILAMSPYTAEHISYQLCQRFVADNPPPALVERAAKTYLKTQGDVPSVLETILTSPEFYSEGAFQAKVKSPFEYVASTLRALNAETDGGPRLLGFIARMGEPMFQYEEPSGYDDTARTWINSGALLARMNFAIQLALGRIPGTSVDWQALSREETGLAPREMMDQLAGQLACGRLSAATEKAILSKLAPGDPAEWGDFNSGQQTRMLASLLIASPEFQRR